MKIDYFKDFIILVAAVVYNQQGEILFVKRNQNHKSFRGFWQLPEGKMEFGEQTQETLLRELKEEVGLKLINSKVLITNSKVISAANKHFHILRIILKVECKGKITLGGEHSTYQWVSLKKAANLRQLFPGLKEALLDLKDQPQAKVK